MSILSDKTEKKALRIIAEILEKFDLFNSLNMTKEDDCDFTQAQNLLKTIIDSNPEIQREKIIKHEFSDWLFDEFVTNERRYGKEARVYWFILRKYAECGFPEQHQEEERRYAKKVSRILDVANRDWKTHLLYLRGQGAEIDFKEQVSKYEARLRAFQYDEETIKNMINEKIRFNDGKDLF